MLKYALLGFLNYNDMTGYELKQVMDSSTENFWHARQSQIYMTLKTLEEGGLLTSVMEEQDGRPDRRIYAITDEGRGALRAWLDTPITELDGRKERLLLKIFFSAHSDKQQLLTQLRLRGDLHQQALQRYQLETRDVIHEASHIGPGMEKDAIMWDATRRFGVMFEEMYVRWLNETIATIEDQL